MSQRNVGPDHLQASAGADAETATGDQPTIVASSSSSFAQPAFALFPNLPRELRDYVWELCRPYRIYEIDDRYWNDQYAERICKQVYTTRQNKRPPMISRICKESRAVALRSGFMDFECRMRPDPPVCVFFEYHKKAARPECSWWDTKHMSATMNFCGFARPEKPPQGLPLELLAWYANRMRGAPCLHAGYLHAHAMITVNMLGPSISDHPMDLDKYREIETELIKQHPVWLVVMATLVLHCEMEDLDGEFGLLNDAPIRLLDPVEDAATIEAFWRKIDALDIEHDRVRRQDWHDPESFGRWLEGSLSSWPKSLRHRFRPMLMIRHCLGQCNHAVKTKSNLPPRHRRPRGLKTKYNAIEGIGEVPFGWDDV